MITLLIWLCVLGGIYWLCSSILAVPQPFLKIILVVLVIVALGLVLNAFGISTGIPVLH